ncbi:LAFA_0F11254g1_1 [Lachancea sp. 'fantastica']|nr:LAFA_0F11254g1_1 [Lachancea sp. 'fantastica']
MYPQLTLAVLVTTAFAAEINLTGGPAAANANTFTTQPGAQMTNNAAPSIASDAADTPGNSTTTLDGSGLPSTVNSTVASTEHPEQGPSGSSGNSTIPAGQAPISPGFGSNSSSSDNTTSTGGMGSSSNSTSGNSTGSGSGSSGNGLSSQAGSAFITSTGSGSSPKSSGSSSGSKNSSSSKSQLSSGGAQALGVPLGAGALAAAMAFLM